jgi:hypothetical protein
VTTSPAADGAAAGASFAEAHRRLLADGSIQFRFSEIKPTPTPAWVKWLAEMLRSPLVKWIFWGLVAAGVCVLLYALSRRLAGARWPWPRRRREEGAQGPEAWRPSEGEARALLAEADALAGEGNYDEAAHLLLFRSIEEIEARRPRLVRPALTSRDIAGAQALPDKPRAAFASIVMAVERSLFAGRSLAAEDWNRCRSAYEDFAFAGAWR